MPGFNPVDFAVPGFVLLVLLEMLWARRHRPETYEPKDTLVSLAFGLGSTVAGLLTGGLVLALMLAIYPFRLLDIGWQWWAWIACFVLDDFVYYWAHRFAHTVRWWWADHVVHHSSQHYNLTTALRQPWVSPLTLKFILFGSWLVLIGFPPAMVALAAAVNLVYQFWIHTEVIGRMPAWFEAVMNTPSHHRVHHATNPRYLDKNYAGVFIIWDKMFGTFQPELEEEACRYGIVRNLGSNNPFLISFHEWWAILKDMRAAKSWRGALGYWLGPPGWSEDQSRETSKMIKARWQARQSADEGDEPAPH